MHTEGLILRRAMLEALFVLGAIWQQPELVRTYVQNDQHRRRDIYKNLKKTSPDSRRGVSAWITDEELDKTIAELSQATKGLTYLSVEQFAQAAKLHDVFLTDYAYYPRPHTMWRGISKGKWSSVKTMRLSLLFGALSASHHLSFSPRLSTKC